MQVIKTQYYYIIVDLQSFFLVRAEEAARNISRNSRLCFARALNHISRLFVTAVLGAEKCQYLRIPKDFITNKLRRLKITMYNRLRKLDLLDEVTAPLNRITHHVT